MRKLSASKWINVFGWVSYVLAILSAVVGDFIIIFGLFMLPYFDSVTIGAILAFFGSAVVFFVNAVWMKFLWNIAKHYEQN